MASPRRGRRDVVLAAVVATVGVVEAVLRDDLRWPLLAVGVGVVMAVAVLFRRDHPMWMVVLGFGTVAVLDAAAAAAGVGPQAFVSAFAVLVLVYSLPRWGSGPDVAAGLPVVAVGFVVAVVADDVGATDAVGGAAVLLAAAAFGLVVRSRSVVREQLVERARLRERDQLARDLHDTVAHHVSGIAIQAQAGAFLARSGSTDAAAAALEEIEVQAGRALTEMRTLVGALRGPSGTAAPVGAIRALGADGGSPPVEVTVRGTAADLPPVVGSALLRVAQESVTNARRHARRASRITVDLHGGVNETDLVVHDDGARTAAPTGAAGYGLVGMAERVGLLGGTFAAGPDPDGGWTVRAVLPHRDGPS